VAIFDPQEATLLAHDPDFRPYVSITADHVLGLLAALGEYALRVGDTPPSDILQPGRATSAAALQCHKALVEFWSDRYNPWSTSSEPSLAFRLAHGVSAVLGERKVFDDRQRAELVFKNMKGLEEISVGELCALLKTLECYAQTARTLPELTQLEGVARLIHAHNRLIAFRDRPFTFDEFRCSLRAVLERVRRARPNGPLIGCRSSVRPASPGTRSLETPDLTVPDYLEPILAWRAWLVTTRVDPSSSVDVLQPRIVSVFKGTVWEPYQALEARHETGTPCVAGSPCRCGIYAFKDPEHLRREIWSVPMRSRVGYSAIIGQVWLWGKLAEHERGWRAQFAYPAQFRWALHCDGSALAATYGIEYQEDESWTSVKKFEPDSQSLFASPSRYPLSIASPIVLTSLQVPPCPRSLLRFPPKPSLVPDGPWKIRVQTLFRPASRLWRASRRFCTIAGRKLADVHDHAVNRRWSGSNGLNIWS
jgi:hypothetical protein